MIKDDQLPDNNIRTIKREMTTIVEGVFLYRSEKYQLIIEKLNPLSEKNLQKHRLLTAAYSRLYGRAVKEKKTDEVANFLERMVDHAKANYDLSLQANKSLTIAEINYADGLLLQGGSLNADHAYELLLVARKDSPQLSIIYYNLAMYFVQKGQLDDALTQLEWAKKYGDFMWLT